MTTSKAAGLEKTLTWLLKVGAMQQRQAAAIFDVSTTVIRSWLSSNHSLDDLSVSYYT